MRHTRWLAYELKLNKQLYDLGLIDHVEYIVRKMKLKVMNKQLQEHDQTKRLTKTHKTGSDRRSQNTEGQRIR